MDLRAKHDRFRGREPPAALFDPPPWAAADGPLLTQAKREQQLRAALEQAAVPACSDTPPAERPDLRRKLARLRNMSPPPAFLAQPPAALRADTQLSQTKGEEAAAFLPQPLAALRADTQLAQTEYEEAAAFLALPLAAASADTQLAQRLCEG